MLAVTKLKMSGSEQKERKKKSTGTHIIFSIKRVARKFLEVSRCSRKICKKKDAARVILSN